MPLDSSPIHRLDRGRFVIQLRRLEGTPEELLQNEELLDVLLPALYADFQLCETYEYPDGSPLRCPVVAYGGMDDAQVQPGDLEAWRQHTTGSFAVRTFPGGHFFLHSVRPAFLEAISGALRNASLA